MEVIGTVLLGLSETLEVKESQIRDNSSAEALHDYRIAVRKTSSLLAQLDGVLPEPGLSRFRKEFSMITKRTGPVRDLEVCFSALTTYSQEMPGNNFTAFIQYVGKRERTQRNRVLRSYRSKKYLAFKHDWQAYIQDTVENERSVISVQSIAREAVHRSYLKTIELSRKTCRRGTTKSFHKLRKSCKRLRYLLDIFRDLLSGEPRKKLVRKLKDLQGGLGRIQDMEVVLDFAGQFVGQPKDKLHKSDKKAVKNLVMKIKKEKQGLKADAAALIGDFSATVAEEIDLLLGKSDKAVLAGMRSGTLSVEYRY